MTAGRMRRVIASVFKAYETDDRAALEEALADDFSLTSPDDDGIGREAYFERCWPSHDTIATMEIQRMDDSSPSKILSRVAPIRPNSGRPAKRYTSWTIASMLRSAQVLRTIRK